MSAPAQPARQPIRTIKLDDGRTVQIFAPTDELWVELNQIDNAPAAPYQSFRLLWAIVLRCSDTTFEGPPRALVALVLAILETWDINNQPLLPVWYHKKARLELERMLRADNAFNALVSLANEPRPDLREQIERAAEADSNQKRITVAQSRQDHVDASETPPPALKVMDKTATKQVPNGQANGLTAAGKALAAAYELRKDGKAVSLKAACDRAGVDRKNIRKRHPEVVNTIKALAVPDRSLPKITRDRRTGAVDAIDDEADE